MQRAIDTGQAQLTDKIKLVQETGENDQAGFLIYLPVYSKGNPTHTIEARRQHVVGWVYSPFRMNDLMNGLFGEHASDLSINIYDGNTTSDDALMYKSDNTNVKHAFELEAVDKLWIAGHPWTIQIKPLSSMTVRVNAVSPITIGLIGITISIFITLLIWSLATARKRALTLASEMNKELNEERNRLNNIIEGTHVGTWVWHIQIGDVVLNDYWANIIGYELSELKPLSIATWLEHLHPDDAKLSAEALQKHFSGELEYYECEVRMRHKDGHWVWILDRGKVTSWTSDGKPLVMYGTHQDITARKQVEEELRVAATAFQSQEGIMVTDKNNVIVRVNDAFTKITGYSSEEAVGQTPHFLSSGRHNKAFFKSMWESLNNQGAWAS